MAAETAGVFQVVKNGNYMLRPDEVLLVTTDDKYKVTVHYIIGPKGRDTFELEFPKVTDFKEFGIAAFSGSFTTWVEGQPFTYKHKSGTLSAWVAAGSSAVVGYCKVTSELLGDNEFGLPRVLEFNSVFSVINTI